MPGTGAAFGRVCSVEFNAKAQRRKDAKLLSNALVDVLQPFDRLVEARAVINSV
jgi:hypothetical protein